MFISKIVLNYFQKHEHLELSFTEGVNYLYGASDAGKSCIRRAIAWVFGFENYSESTIRRDGSKVTSVIVTLDTGIEVERVRSATINRYIVRTDGTEKVYDSVGKTAPDEVKQVLGVRTINVDDKEKELNLNIAEQISLPFLMDKSPSYRLKLFNKLTGNDLVDKVIQNFNKSILQIGRDIKVEQEFITTNKPKLEEVTIQHANEASLLGNLKVKREAILLQVEKYNNLFSLKGKLDVNASSLVMTRITLKDYKIVSDDLIGKLKSLIGKYNTLTTFSKAYNENTKSFARIKIEMETIKVVSLDFAGVKEKIARREKLQTITSRLSELFDKRQETIIHIDAANGHIKDFEKKYKELLTEAKVCPLCKQSTCEVH